MSTHIVVWPKVNVYVEGELKTLERGDPVPEGVSRFDLESLSSFGAIKHMSA